jgi:hypothetical protein
MFKTISETESYKGYTLEITTKFTGDRISGQQVSVAGVILPTWKDAKQYVDMLNFNNK